MWGRTNRIAEVWTHSGKGVGEAGRGNAEQEMTRGLLPTGSYISRHHQRQHPRMRMQCCSLARAAATSLNPADPARTLVGEEDRAGESIQSRPEDLGQSTIAFETIVPAAL